MQIEVLRKRIEDRISEVKQEQLRLSEELELVKQVESIAPEFEGVASDQGLGLQSVTGEADPLWRRRDDEPLAAGGY